MRIIRHTALTREEARVLRALIEWTTTGACDGYTPCIGTEMDIVLRSIARKGHALVIDGKYWPAQNGDRS